MDRLNTCMTKKKIVSISLDPEDHYEMQDAAKHRGISLSEFIRWMWREYGQRSMHDEDDE